MRSVFCVQIPVIVEADYEPGMDEYLDFQVLIPSGDSLKRMICGQVLARCRIKYEEEYYEHGNQSKNYAEHSGRHNPEARADAV